MTSYRRTLNLFSHGFPMRAQLVAQEPRWLAFWQTNLCYPQANTPVSWQWSLHDGPVFANGELHIGHGYNRILKDIMVRFHQSMGRNSSIVIGWDTHGWPIESAILKQKKPGSTLQPGSQLRQLAQQYVTTQISAQKKTMARLGLWTNFQQTYQTNRWSFEHQELQMFLALVKKKALYRALKPTLWCCRTKQVIPATGADYLDQITTALYVCFAVVSSTTSLPANTALLVYTTTAWTLPANQLLAINQDWEYVLLQQGQRYLVMASSLWQQKKPQWNTHDTTKLTLIKVIPGIALLSLQVISPYTQQKVGVVNSEHVTVAKGGTGIVHIAGAYGPDDYLLVKRHHLPLKLILAGDGTFLPGQVQNDLAGRFYQDGNAVIIAQLQQNQKIFWWEKITHSVPVNSRNHNPLIYFASWQWFINLTPYKATIQRFIGEIKWTPQWAQKHMAQMVADRTEWCLSRQRQWGVPLIEFIDRDGQVHMDAHLVAHAIEQLALDQSCNLWWSAPCDFFLPPEYQNLGWTKGTSVLDVWFDSGCSYQASLPANAVACSYWAICEGKDQFRGWFNSSIIIGAILATKPPFQSIMVHGFAIDKTGAKMSKSQKNGITLTSFLTQYGVDIFRLWVANTELGLDFTLNEDVLVFIQQQYRKIRNTLRFIIANTIDYCYEQQSTVPLAPADLFVLAKLKILLVASQTWYPQWQWRTLLEQVMFFVNDVLSSFYFEASKVSLYTFLPDDPRRRAIQTTLFYLGYGLLAILKPILVFTSEEAFQQLPDYVDKPKSVFQVTRIWDQWPALTTEDIAGWEKMLSLKRAMNKIIPVAQKKYQVKSTQSLAVWLQLDDPELQQFLTGIPHLSSILVVDSVTFTNTLDDALPLDRFGVIKVRKVIGNHCHRCWCIIMKEQCPSELCQRCACVVAHKQKSQHE